MRHERQGARAGLGLVKRGRHSGSCLCRCCVMLTENNKQTLCGAHLIFALPPTAHSCTCWHVRELLLLQHCCFLLTLCFLASCCSFMRISFLSAFGAGAEAGLGSSAATPSSSRSSSCSSPPSSSSNKSAPAGSSAPGCLSCDC